MVRATVSSPSTRTSPRMAVQRIRLWASTAHCSQAELAWKLPGGDVVEPGPFFEVADGEFDDGVVAVEPVDVDGVAVDVGEEGVVTPVGPQTLLGGAGQPGATHDRVGASCRRRPCAGGVGTLGDLRFAVGGVVDGRPGVLGDAGDRRRDPLVLVRTAIV